VKPDIGSESRFLLTPPAFDVPVRGRWGGRSRRNIAMPFSTKKTPLVWLAGGENFFEDIFIYFDKMYERDRHTDRRTPHDG